MKQRLDSDHEKQGAEIPGMIDLLAVGPKGCLLIDHKTGGAGAGFGLYWPQLSSYAALVERLFPQHTLQGVAVFWVDHGLLELAEPQYLGHESDLTVSF